ncbi:MAG TPA: hypothetical protein VGL78_14890 [Solirubrobacteraceae bacterium]
MALVESERTDEAGSPEALIREARELQRRRRRRRAAVALVGLLALGGGIVLVAGGGGPSAGRGLVGALPAGIAARAGDPAGGLAWGIRVVRASGWTCLQLGRLRGDQLGVIGKDGAFGDDGRFHPFAPSTTKQAYCAQNDPKGHAFLNAQLAPQPASAAGAGSRTVPKCHPAADVAQAKRTLSRRGRSRAVRSRALRVVDAWRVCPSGDLRYVQYGLLGPDATGVTYTLGGRSEVQRTRGPDGAYLIVGPPGACGRLGLGSDCAGTGPVDSPQIFAGMITAVDYRDGRTCSLNRSRPGEPAVLVSCPRVGYLPAKLPIGEARVATPISVRLITAKHYCFTRRDRPIKRSAPAPETDRGPYIPCDGPVPANEVRDLADQHGTLVVFSWIAREPVNSPNSSYAFMIRAPCGTGGGGPTIGRIRAGELLTRGQFEPSGCTGTFTGAVAYNPNVGPGGPTGPALFPRRNGSIIVTRGWILVGRFAIAIR